MVGKNYQLPVHWESTAAVLKETDKKVLVYLVDRGKKGRKYGGGMRKYSKVFKGNISKKSGMLKEMKKADRLGD